jgi:hypothetical protein
MSKAILPQIEESSMLDAVNPLFRTSHDKTTNPGPKIFIDLDDKASRSPTFRCSRALENLEHACCRQLDLHVKGVDFLEKWLSAKGVFLTLCEPELA